MMIRTGNDVSQRIIGGLWTRSSWFHHRAIHSVVWQSGW